MRIRLFLTSMLAVMVACPAFATTPTIPADPNSPTLSANCSSPTIGDAQPGGTVYYVALWENNKCSITLNQNGASTDSSPTSLVSVYGEGAYLGESNNSPVNLMSTNAHNVTVPDGPSVTITYVDNLPAGHALDEVTNWPNASSLTSNRPFDGFFSSTAPGATQYIDADGYITYPAGTTAASTIAYDQTGACPNDTIWYAQWGCVNAGATPSLTGYTFDGWTDSNDDDVSDFCVTASDTWTAQWLPNTGTIHYTCGTEGNIAGGTGIGGTAPSDDASLVYDAPYVLASTPGDCATPTGRHFAGWLCDQSLDNNSVSSYSATEDSTTHVWSVSQSGTFKIAATAPATNTVINCVAQWGKNPINLSWNRDGGDWPVDPQTNEPLENPLTCEHNDPMGPVYQPTRTGYTFKGWDIVPQ